jgi:DNA-binding MarR family transcriptional regulator
VVRSEAGEASGPPFVGALLRLCWRRVRGRMREAIRAAGFADLQDAHLAVFSHPLPDGVRPSELARRIGTSRQAANHLIAQMEALGYLERRAAEGGDRRLVHLTERGWQVGETIFACLRQLQAEWAEEVGHDRFDDFMGVLRFLATDEPHASSR